MMLFYETTLLKSTKMSKIHGGVELLDLDLHLLSRWVYYEYTLTIKAEKAIILPYFVYENTI
jgi:hypothetical protein